ncbi:hypothetical protein BGZ76_003291 [Entomortierella beljakovae]|nr:hypothetical protein BGZ76_003291 [Entomortierella beljakovae]
MFPSRVLRFAASSPFSVGSRHVLKSLYAAERPEGMGATVRRSLGTRLLRNHDPFLLLDEFEFDSSAGFPEHPHRGFETVTYMLTGQMQHEDFTGKSGTIGPGDLQWMTAGRGVMHCEMPVKDQARIHGLQLWVNLSRKDKMCEPQYQDLRDSQIPRTNPIDGVEVKVIAGEAHGVRSDVLTRTPTMYLDYKMKRDTVVEVAIPKEYSGFVYMLSGKAYFGDGTAVVSSLTTENLNDKHNHIIDNDDVSKPFQGLPHHALVLSKDDISDTLKIQTKDEDAHFVVLAGQPLQEPVVMGGVFVMNTKQEVDQALEDFREFKNGFERAKEWRSKISPKGYRLKF